MSAGRGQPLFIFPEKLKPRVREGGHFWGDPRPLRFFRKSFPKKIYKNLSIVYQALMQIDSDFYKQREDKNFAIGNITKTCASYGGIDIKTATMYLQLLKNLTLIDYGRKRDKSGKVIGSYLVMYEWIPFIEYYEIFVQKNEFLRENYNGNIDPDTIDPFTRDNYESDGKNHIPKNGGKVKQKEKGYHTPKKPYKVKRGVYKNVNKSDKNESRDSKNASHSIGTDRSRQKTPLESSIKVKIQRSSAPNNNGKIFESDFESKDPENPEKYLSEYQVKQGFGKSSYSPILVSRYNELKKKGIPVDVESLKSMIEFWNDYVEKNGENIKVRKGVSLPMHSTKLNKSLLHMQVAVTYMTKISGFSLEQLLTGLRNFLGLYLNGHSYSRKTNLIGSLTLREKAFLQCIDGSINKNPKFHNISKEAKNLKFFIKKSIKGLYADNGGRRNISSEDEAYARGREAELMYEQYMINNTNLTGKQIDRKISEERKLLN
jgi:hypothetical protein